MTDEPLYLIPTDIDQAALMAARSREPVRTLAGNTMGTSWRLSFAAAEAVANTDVVSLLGGVFEEIIEEISNWDPSSHVSRFNTAEPGWRELPPHFFKVLMRAVEIATESGGAFDPALGREVGEAGFGPAGGQAGGQSPGVGGVRWKGVWLDPLRGAAFQPGRAQLDLSGIGKGYAVDVCAARLSALGIANFLMEIGGEFVGRGLRPEGGPWRVDLDLSDLSPASGEPPAIRVAVCGLALAASGDFVRRRNGAEGQVSHLIDGRTRKPAGQTLSGVSVIASSCMDADAWATALHVLGSRDGIAVAEKRGIAAVFAERTPAGARYLLSSAAQAMTV